MKAYRIRGMTIKQAQAKCRRWKSKGDKRSLAAAKRLERDFSRHPDYESDDAFFLRIQASPDHLFTVLRELYTP